MPSAKAWRGRPGKKAPKGSSSSTRATAQRRVGNPQRRPAARAPQPAAAPGAQVHTHPRPQMTVCHPPNLPSHSLTTSETTQTASGIVLKASHAPFDGIGCTEEAAGRLPTPPPEPCTPTSHTPHLRQKEILNVEPVRPRRADELDLTEPQHEAEEEPVERESEERRRRGCDRDSVPHKVK